MAIPLTEPKWVRPKKLISVTEPEHRWMPVCIPSRTEYGRAASGDRTPSSSTIASAMSTMLAESRWRGGMRSAR